MPQSLTQQLSREQQIAALEKDWAQNPRWKGIKRGYSAADVVRLRGSLQPEHTLARRGAEKLWEKVNGGAKKGYVNSFGAISAGQAMQQAKAGLEAVYLSGWQVAADGNSSETMYPDQSLVMRSLNSWFIIVITTMERLEIKSCFEEFVFDIIYNGCVSKYICDNKIVKGTSILPWSTKRYTTTSKTGIASVDED